MRDWQAFFTHIKSKGFNPTTVIDVGVATDTDELYVHFPQARYLFVEPLAEFEPNLQQLCQRYPGSNYMLAAAGADNGEITFNVGPSMGDSSIYQTIECRDGAYEMYKRTVPQYRLDTMWEALELTGPTLLKVDVQGGEIEVLKGATTIMDQFEVIILECGMIESYIGQPIFHEYVAYLADHGFVVYDIIHTGFSETGLLAQIDLVFVKKDGQFRQDQRCQTDYAKANYTNLNYKGITRNENL
jgi:FkbM family methyltransferase